MAITPQDNSAFMREVDEEVRRDQAADFWNRWGKWVAVLVIGGLALLAGWMYWSYSDQTAAEGEVQELSDILRDIGEGNIGDADERLATLSESSRPGVRAAALLSRADLALQNEELPAAIGHFSTVAADESLPQQYRDLALIRQTAVEYEDMEPQAVIDRLAGLAQPGNPWFGSAGELTATALMAQDKNDEAGALWAQIAQDEGVPETLQTRAVQMAGVLGIDAVPDEPVDMDDGVPPPAPGAALAAPQAEAGQ